MKTLVNLAWGCWYVGRLPGNDVRVHLTLFSGDGRQFSLLSETVEACYQTDSGKQQYQQWYANELLLFYSNYIQPHIQKHIVTTSSSIAMFHSGDCHTALKDKMGNI